ncbi:unnamed protein product [Echinostoma caproni]|uniref:Uncharacterized protein n=1 Tax=Echinostoma caproni TaxID=27848 RepID=A0A3P8HVK7_9TREM|nr:unnamed protein product [Echinostoma caproni]
MERDLEQIARWAKERDLRLNVTKSHVLTGARDTTVVLSEEHEFAVEPATKVKESTRQLRRGPPRPGGPIERKKPLLQSGPRGNDSVPQAAILDIFSTYENGSLLTAFFWMLKELSSFP